MNRKQRDGKLEAMTRRESRLVQQIQISLAEIESCNLFVDTAFVRKWYNISPVLTYSRQEMIGKSREWTFSNMSLATTKKVQKEE